MQEPSGKALHVMHIHLLRPSLALVPLVHRVLDVDFVNHLVPVGLYRLNEVSWEVSILVEQDARNPCQNEVEQPPGKAETSWHFAAIPLVDTYLTQPKAAVAV